MEIRQISVDDASLVVCAELFKTVFPQAQHLTEHYLRWLYCDNPAGQVLGYNAWHDGILAAHYACIPVDVMLDGQPARALLSLNTATHPDFQGQGLFVKMAQETYELGVQRGFDCVYGVANATSTGGFVRKLGFQGVAQLDVRVGLGSLRPDWRRAVVGNRFRRRWSAQEATWRSQNPANAMALLPRSDGTVITRAKTNIPGVCACGVMPTEEPVSASAYKGGVGLNLFLGLLPPGSCRFTGYLAIPERFKPSPLNFIYRALSDKAPQQLAVEEIVLGFHDFDPY